MCQYYGHDCILREEEEDKVVSYLVADIQLHDAALQVPLALSQ
jgi:hypothetical protein